MEDDGITPGVIYDAGCDVEGLFPMEFRQYVREQNLLCRARTHVTRLWAFENKQEPSADGVTSAYRLLAYKLTLFFEGVFAHYPTCLVQFWRAEEVANSANDFGERRFQLTTHNQPFLLRVFPMNKKFNKGICSYRMKTRDIIITGDGRGGPISRVFKNKRMEITPDVEYYSYEEFPQRDTAISCLIFCSLVLPLSDSYGRTVGVIEFVSRSHWPRYFMDAFLLALRESDLMYLDPCEGLCGQYDLDKDSLRSAVSEIKEVIDVLRRSLDIVTAQTWMLCKRCNSLSTSQRCAEKPYASRWTDEFGSYCILREGEGVIGRAAMSSYNLVYCEDVAKFSIIEYPFAHFVRKYNLSASFAICLQSILSGDQVYVLEFFLGSSYGNWGLRKKLVPILDKMRQGFRTFKVAYGGEEIGDNLSVLVVDASSPDKVVTLKNEPMDLALAIGAYQLLNLSYYFDETDDPMIGVETPFQDISINNVPVASASTVQSEIRMTVKANYGSDFVEFQFNASLGVHELYHQMSQKLELKEGTYDLSYRDDDNDLILLRCDDDLQFYISSSTEQGNYTLLVSIEPKCASPM